MKNRGFVIKMAALLCAAALLCTGLTGCKLLERFLPKQATEPTKQSEQVQIVTAEPLQVYAEPDLDAQVVGSIPTGTQIAIIQTVDGFAADGSDVIWGQLAYNVGWVILHAGEDAAITPTQPQEPTIYNTKLLPRSESDVYTCDEVVLALVPWMEAGYSYAEALGLARNEIYANHGYAFSGNEYIQYFYRERAELYSNNGLSAQQAQQQLSASERKNIDLLLEMEDDCKDEIENEIYSRKLLPESAKKAYTREEVVLCLVPWLEDGYYLQEALMLARNEIFANYGYEFSDNALRYYFNYAHRHLYGDCKGLKDVSALLNGTEVSNVDFLYAWQKTCAEPDAPSHTTPKYQWPITAGVLVFDLENAYIVSNRYHIPYVDGMKYSAVNKKIQDRMMPHATEMGWDDIDYCVGYSGDVVTILVECEGYSDDRMFCAFYFSRSTGKLQEQADVLAQFGLSRGAFEDLVTERSLDCYEKYNAGLKQEHAQWYEEMRQETVDNTLQNTEVFIDPNGNLGFVAYISVPAGSGHTDLELPCWEDAPVTGVQFSW